MNEKDFTLIKAGFGEQGALPFPESHRVQGKLFQTMTQLPPHYRNKLFKQKKVKDEKKDV